MIRFFDLLISFLGLILLSPLLLLITIIIYFENKSPFFLQKRVGKSLKIFTLIKFRTMALDTLDTPSHLLKKAKITKLGIFLRKYKIDELPQLFNVLRGEMSIVGPRPSLPTQIDLIKSRKNYGLFNVKPGITGLAQIKGIDMSDPLLLAKTDYEMVFNFNPIKYFFFIFFTLIGFGSGDKVNH